jgi:uncharacterized membrane protein
MTRVEHSIVIKAPISQVFEYASDYRKWSEWFEGVSDFRPSTSISRGNGTRYAYKARMMGLSVGVETEVHNFEENRGWTGIATKGMPHRTHWLFEPVEGGTKFTYTLEYQLPVPLIGSLIDSSFMKPQWDKIIRTSLNNLGQHFKDKAGTVSP